MIIRSRAPLRLGLAGGGTDVSPFCDVHGGLVLNATIDRYAYAVLRPLPGQTVVRFVASDLEKSVSSHISDRQLHDCEGLALHRAVYLRVMDQYNNGQRLPLELTTFCDAPAGSGLGSSSTLVVAMLKAFVEFLNLPLEDYGIARLAFEIERMDCGLAGGKQDQYSAAFGGFNFMEFYGEGRVVVNPLRVKDWVISELEASTILFYTGVSRESAKIIADQSSNVQAGMADALEAMHGLKKEALLMKESLLRGDFEGIFESMRSGWASKKKSARTVSNSHIDEIYNAAITAGAVAGKVSGAGGGGFMMFFFPPEKRLDVIRALKKFDGVVSNCHFTSQGTQAWKVN